MIAALTAVVLCLDLTGCARIQEMFHPDQEEAAEQGEAADNAAEEKTGEAAAEGEEAAQQDGKQNDAESVKDPSTSYTRKEGAVLNIFTWDSSLRGILQTYNDEYEELTADEGKMDGVTIRWHEIGPDEYQEELDKQLLRNNYFETDDKVDIYLVDGDSLSKYINTEFSMDLVKGLGFSENTLSDQFPFTVQAATNGDGILKGVSWIASPGVFLYRRSIAQQVFGTDDPATVQAAVEDWDQFAASAATANAKGYKMVSGIDDSYYAFRGASERPWVLNGEVLPDESALRWADQTRAIYAGGFTNDTFYKGKNWMRDLGVTGNVLGFFLSAYEIRQLTSEDGAGGSGAGIGLPIVNSDSTDGGEALQSGQNSASSEASKLAAQANLAYGDYAMCLGPQVYARGGIWMMVSPDTDNPALAKKLLEYMAGDTAMLEQLARDGQIFTNSRTAMVKMAREQTNSVLFNDQNQFAVYLESAEKAAVGPTSVYDNKLGYLFRRRMSDYIYGNMSREEALDWFYTRAWEEYPILKPEDAQTQR